MRSGIPVIAAVALTAAMSSVTAASAGPPSETFAFTGLGQVMVYEPHATPSEVVLFISGDGGWNLGVIPMAETLRDLGALVVGIDVRRLMKTMQASGGCAYPAGLLEEVSRMAQLRHKLPEYKPPILVGYSSGATLVYAALAAAPPEAFAGAISLGFCPDLELDRPVCELRGLTARRRMKGVGYDLGPNRAIQPPWMVLQGEIDQVCTPAATKAFVAAIPAARLFSLPMVGHGFGVPRNWQRQYVEAYRAVTAQKVIAPQATAPAIRDLSLAEVTVSASARTDTMAIILTGDGGWAELDRGVARGLAACGIPSVGWSSLRYYWTPRTPETAAADLTRIIQHYLSEWNIQRVIVVGYSFGADVLPFLVNRLPDDVLARVRSVALLGLSESATFEFRLSSWISGGGNSTYRTVPEVERLRVPVVCVRGGGEDESACLALKGSHISSIQVGRGHHFSGDYASLARSLLAADRSARATRRD